MTDLILYAVGAMGGPGEEGSLENITPDSLATSMLTLSRDTPPSPIELRWLAAFLRVNGIGPEISIGEETCENFLRRLELDPDDMLCVVRGRWCLMAQMQLGRYRADFAFVSPAGGVVVECDGHDYHERSKEQAKRDRRRDRWMQAQGWNVLRFTGSEIWKDAEACAQEVFDYLDGLVARYLVQHPEMR